MTKIHLANDQRLIVVGATGSGKTVLIKHFLSRLNRVFVIDPKHTFKLDGYKVRRGLPMFGSEFRVIFRPRKGDDDQMSDLLRDLFKMKNVTIYCDELATLAEVYKETTETLADISRTGRERRVSVWAALQRPRWVPRVFFTEAENMFIFNLRSEEDRQYMAKFTDPMVEDQIEKFTFWYFHPDQDRIALMKYDLSKNYIKIIG